MTVFEIEKKCACCGKPVKLHVVASFTVFGTYLDTRRVGPAPSGLVYEVCPECDYVALDIHEPNEHITELLNNASYKNDNHLQKLKMKALFDGDSRLSALCSVNSSWNCNAEEAVAHRRVAIEELLSIDDLNADDICLIVDLSRQNMKYKFALDLIQQVSTNQNDRLYKLFDDTVNDMHREIVKWESWLAANEDSATHSIKEMKFSNSIN